MTCLIQFDLELEGHSSVNFNHMPLLYVLFIKCLPQNYKIIINFLF